MKRIVRMLAFATLAAVIAVPAAHGGLGGLLDKAKDKVKQRVEQKTDHAMDHGLDAAEGAATPGAAAGTKPAAAATGSTGAPGATSDADQQKPGQGAWANYDFKPGSRILFADDFTKDEIGDFPRRLEFKDGAMELVEWQQGRWLRLSNTSHFYVPLPEVLPERYTLEFDCSVPGGEMWIYPDPEQHGQSYLVFGNGGVGGVVAAGGITARSNAVPELRDKVFHARVMADGAYVKVYVNDKRCVNVPNFGAFRSNKIMFWVDAHENSPAMFGNFRIAAGGKKLYDALATDGRVATQGIYFDTGSDRIRPESTPTLKEIAAMLTEHPELKLVIEGHTDNVGVAATNQSLSEKRAAAVRQALVDSFGVDGARLTTKGLGATKPVAPNTTPEGRQNNRRVELVKV
jgi:outer membrane protein OmpA-like peptidoglycan-associated protein